MSGEDILRRRLDREISARKQAEHILEKKALELFEANQELLSLNASLESQVAERTSFISELFDNMYDACLVVDKGHRVQEFNKSSCLLFGFAAPEMKNLFLPDIGLYAESAQSKKYLDQLQSAGRFKDYHTTIRNKKGQQVYVEINSTAIIDKDGNYQGHRDIIRDITERKMAEQALLSAQSALEKSEHKYRNIIENMKLGLMEVDNDGMVTHVYDGFCEMTGYSKDDLTGKDAASILLPAKYREIVNRSTVDRLMGTSSVYEIELIKKSGDHMWVLISGAPIFDLEGEIVGSIGIHYDVTERKNLESALTEAKRIAEEAHNAEKQFIANMSHEIRTPLNAIIGMGHLLKDTSLEFEQREYVETLMHSGNLLKDLISDILDMSKIESGELEILNREFNLTQLINTIERMFQIRFEKKELKFEVIQKHEIKQLIKGDDILLNQVLINLLGNAYKFTEQGSVKLSVNIADESTDNYLLVFMVEDSGIGISAENQKNIFDKFRQVGNAAYNKQGTGLGLAIVKRIIEGQNGRIWVKSEIGVGTKISFELRFAKSKTSINIKESQDQNLHAELLTNCKILVAEDNVINLRYVARLLEKWKIEYVHVWNGAEAVSRCENEHFDIILMDIQMPEMDGFEATTAIRSSNVPNSQRPIIGLTASATRENWDRARAVGINDFITKPFSPESLKSILLKNITAGQSHSERIEIDLFSWNEKLDTITLDELYNGDLEHALEMFDLFTEEIVPQLAMFHSMMAAGEWLAITKLAHKIKPTLSMVGLPSIGALFEEIQHASIEGEAARLALKIMVEKAILETKNLVPNIEDQKNALHKSIYR